MIVGEPFNPLSDKWNELISSLPNAHILQTRQWAEVKRQFGWQPDALLWRDSNGRLRAAALILTRQLALPWISRFFNVVYSPKGPLLDWSDAELRQRVLADLRETACERNALFVKIDPEVILGREASDGSTYSESMSSREVEGDLRETGWRFSAEQIQFRNTMWLELNRSDDQILAAMKQKTRYNIRLAERKGVEVRIGTRSDLEYLYEIYAETSLRDGFVIRNKDYYLTLWSHFMQANMAEPLLAYVGDEIVAGLIVFYFAGRAWYLFGMSRESHREKMPNHLLQWRAIQRAKERGCLLYDFWGAPDAFVPTDRMWGVYRFKQGFGAEVVYTLGAWDYPCRIVLYTMYSQLLPRLLSIWRRVGMWSTRRRLEDSI